MENKCYICSKLYARFMETAWYVFCSGQLLVEKSGDGVWHIPHGDDPPVEVPVGSTVHTLCDRHGCESRTYCIYTPVAGDKRSGRMMCPLRSSFDLLSRDEYDMAGKASQILNWDRNSRYCPMCGCPTKRISRIGKRCPECRQEFYPHISPAIIVLIKREPDSVLLVHARNFRGTYYGLVAGFVEPGETLEQCVHREVMEETGITIKNLKYFGSQPWPYPSGIMVGFHAEYEGGEIKLQDEELSAGAFYSRDRLPEIPGKMSIARRLIDAWLDGEI